jgi:hypothetical protein
MRKGSYEKMERGKYSRSRNERRIDSQVNDSEARVVNGYVPLRGTPEWDRREQQREKLGCCCLSFGPLPYKG